MLLRDIVFGAVNWSFVKRCIKKKLKFTVYHWRLLRCGCWLMCFSYSTQATTTIGKQWEHVDKLPVHDVEQFPSGGRAQKHVRTCYKCIVTLYHSVVILAKNRKHCGSTAYTTELRYTRVFSRLHTKH
jgi:hypothetical protein